MNLDTPFNAGPRLSDPPKGDPSTEAIAALRGYAYQVYVSSIAWSQLSEGQDLYLEVARDYAVVAGHALKMVEVKDTPSRGVLRPGSAALHAVLIRSAPQGALARMARSDRREYSGRQLSALLI